MRSTGPILTIGGLTLFNQVLLQGKAIDWRIPIATGMAAGAFALLEQISADMAVGLAYVALVSTLVVPIGGSPSLLEAVRDKFVGTPEPTAPLQR